MRKYPEQILQKSIVTALRKVLPQDAQIVAYPLGGGGRLRGSILVGMGAMQGFPDLFLIHHGFIYGMEVKIPGKGATEEQKAVHATLGIAGMDVRVIRSIDDAVECLGVWGVPTRIVGEWKSRRAA